MKEMIKVARKVQRRAPEFDDRLLKLPPTFHLFKLARTTTVVLDFSTTMAAPHPVIAYTSEASWAMVGHCERLKLHGMLTSTSSRSRTSSRLTLRKHWRKSSNSSRYVGSDNKPQNGS